MLYSKRGKTMVGLLVLALVVAASVVVLGKPDPVVAQAPSGINEGAPQGPGWPMRPEGFPGGPAGPPMMGAITTGGTVAITAADGFVYVVQGNTLYQFSAKTLKVVNKAQLTTTTTPPRYPMTPGTPAPAPGM